MRKLLSLVIVLALIASPVFANSKITYEQDKSLVHIKYKTEKYEDIRVIVSKGKEQYTYQIYDEDETLPLQMGSGYYSVGIYKKISGNRYRKVSSKGKNVKLKKNQVYLQSVQNIDWSDKSKAIKLAKELSLEKAKDEENFKKIYDEIVKSIMYDHQKASVVGQRYLTVIDNTLASKKGICLDYSAIMASMLRSIGIPTKMIHGNTEHTVEYHAWNEVLLNGKWITFDTTIDAQLSKWNVDYEIDRSDEEYVPVKNF